MSKIIVQNGCQAGREIELKPGVLQLGRIETNDLFVPEPSISSRHCELTVSDIGVAVRDLDSTNGTYINGQRVAKGMLQNGDCLRAGEIDFIIELSEVHIAIPDGALQIPEAPGAAFLEDGTPACFSHREVAALFRCTQCENWWCGDCIRQMKRLSGDFLNFCPDCSAACVVLPADNGATKKSFFRRVSETLRINPRK